MNRQLYKQAKHIVQTIMNEEDQAKWPPLVDRACPGDGALKDYVSQWLRAAPFIFEPPQMVKDHYFSRSGVR